MPRHSYCLRDFSFYQFPSDDYWRGFLPEPLRASCSPSKFPSRSPRRSSQACPLRGARGLENPSFLDADLFSAAFARPVVAYRRQTAVSDLRVWRLLAPELLRRSRVRGCAGSVPGGTARPVPLCGRDPQPGYLGTDYFACLRRHNVAHVYNAWSRMPELKDQIAIEDSRTAAFPSAAPCCATAIYEDAVEPSRPTPKSKTPIRTRARLYGT